MAFPLSVYNSTSGNRIQEPNARLLFIPASNESKSCLHDLDDCHEGRIPSPLEHFKFDAPLLEVGYLTVTQKM